MNTASVDWGSVPLWIVALTPLIVAGVLSRAINRTANILRESLRPTRPRSLRKRLRATLAPPHHTTGCTCGQCESDDSGAHGGHGTPT